MPFRELEPNPAISDINLMLKADTVDFIRDPAPPTRCLDYFVGVTKDNSSQDQRPVSIAKAAVPASFADKRHEDHELSGCEGGSMYEPPDNSL